MRPPNLLLAGMARGSGRTRFRGKSITFLSARTAQVLTVGAALALYFASSGIESLRIGLNRAYTVVETRPLWLLRIESIGICDPGRHRYAGASRFLCCLRR